MARPRSTPARSAMEFMARLAALIAPPRYPLVRYAGVLGPRSAWRKDVVPRPRERPPLCDGAASPVSDASQSHGAKAAIPRPRSDDAAGAVPARPRSVDGLTLARLPGGGPLVGDVVALAPNVLSVRHWDRLVGGVLYAATPRVDWARLLRRSFDVDVMRCPRCHGRLRVLAVITEREPIQRILAYLAVPIDAPPLARARDPTDDLDDVEPPEQLELAFA